jgi:hypothetical protein
MAAIDFCMENIKKCLCKDCKVQIDSLCVRDKLKIMLLITQQDLDSPMRMDPEVVPGLYCSTGKALCTDIKFQKQCKCVECEIWDKFNLEPQKYFCKSGKK